MAYPGQTMTHTLTGGTSIEDETTLSQTPPTVVQKSSNTDAAGTPETARMGKRFFLNLAKSSVEMKR